jgi:rare lipoprotein A
LPISHRFRSGIFRTLSRASSRKRFLGVGIVLAGAGFGGCAQQPQQIAAASHGKEYFPASIYGAASRRVIADGQPIPRGGGQYLVGKPYVVAGHAYYPSERKIVQVGYASWYGDAFHGRLTANGEIYDRDGFTAAHPTMPLPSYARVTNLRNNASMIVRVNDRGPYASNRVMDVSRRVAESLDFQRTGTAKIKVEYVGRASLDGSDDAKLYATLRRDGAPAQWPGERTMVAQAEPAARVASLASDSPGSGERLAETIVSHRMAAAEPERSARALHREQRDLPRPAIIREAVAESRMGRTKAARELVEQENGRQDNDRRAVAGFERHGQPPRPPVRLASDMPHLPIRDLLPGRQERQMARHAEIKGGVAPAMVPPARPAGLARIARSESRSGPRHQPVGLRLARARDD